MKSTTHDIIVARLTQDRLESYLIATDGDSGAAIGLYDWNTSVASALHADLGRLEVIFRNAIDQALVRHGEAKGWQTAWYRRRQLFAGREGSRAWNDIDGALYRAGRKSSSQLVHGKVIAELSFGFWRYLCRPTFGTSIWVPAAAAAFPGHPDAPDPHRIRADVEDRVQRLHFLRNRIAHHEPIHRRDLKRDRAQLLELVQWICPHCHAWVTTNSISEDMLAARPRHG